jgi:hypothetical protein
LKMLPSDWGDGYLIWALRGSHTRNKLADFGGEFNGVRESTTAASSTWLATSPLRFEASSMAATICVNLSRAGCH